MNVKYANQKQLSEFLNILVFTREKLVVNIVPCCVKDISRNTKDAILQILEVNMRILYEDSDWGWNCEKKIKELFNKESKYLLIYNDKLSGNDNLKLVGFCHFRFDLDYGYEVLYCYELQLHPNYQRMGIGNRIMCILEDLAYQTKMEKIVLTVLNNNSPSFTFFKDICRFKIDASSPNPPDKFCYTILSKALQP